MLTTELKIILGLCLLAAAFLAWWYAWEPVRNLWTGLTRKQRRNACVGIRIAVFALWVWPTPYRYWHVGGWQYRMNRVTSSVYQLSGGTWELVE